MASAFVGKCASITAVDLIQRKKLDSRNFYESNLTEARFNSLPFYSNNYGIAIVHILVQFRNSRTSEWHNCLDCASITTIFMHS